MNFSSLSRYVSLAAIALSVAAAPALAHADPAAKAPAAAPAGGMGIMAMQSVRQQIRQSAIQNGQWPKGSYPSLRLQYSPSGKTVQAAVYMKTNFAGPPTPLAHPVRMLNSTATFRVHQTSEGKLAVPVKTEGETWHMLMRALAKPATPAK